MSIPQFKKIEKEQDFQNIIKYCKSWVNHYFTYFQINNFTLTNNEIERLKNELIKEGYTIREHINSHGVPCFWVLK